MHHSKREADEEAEAAEGKADKAKCKAWVAVKELKLSYHSEYIS